MTRHEEVWTRRAERFTEHPIRESLKWLLGIIAVIALLSLVTMPLGWGFAWLGKAAEVSGPENVDEQFTSLYGDIAAMRATAANTCAAKETTEEEGDPMLLEDPSFAYAAKYRSIEADYNRRSQNLFEAGTDIAFPGDLPRTAPTLKEMQTQVC